MTDIVTFDDAPEPGTIHFGIGQPSSDLLPVEILRAAAEDYLRRARPAELNYGAKQGDRRFRETLAAFLTCSYGEKVAPESLFVTAGASQGLDLLCAQLTRPGDTILVEEPTYFLAYRIFAGHRLRVVGIPVDAHGPDLDRLEAEVRKRRPALLYTIPTYHNPGGHTMSADRRRRLVELSRRHRFPVVADEVYHLLSYGAPPPATLASMADGGTVLSLGSFSKILAPALRLGWIQSTPDMSARLISNGVVNSGGSLNHFTSNVVRHAIDLGLQESHITRLRDAYRPRVEAMHGALHEHLGESVSWRRPAGGYYFWLELAESVSAAALQVEAAKRGIGFQPGEVFSCSGGLRNFLRLSFAHYDEAAIRTGIERLAALLAAR